MIRVLVVDDSPLVRRVLTQIFRSSPELEVVGEAGDPYEARDQVVALKPDVITLDVEMPKMNGVTFLKNLMRQRPTPVVMVSTITERGAAVTMAALDAGAVDFFAKPKINMLDGLEREGALLISKVKYAAKVDLARLVSERKRTATITKPPKIGLSRPTERVVAIGSSTGGPDAVAQVLASFPSNSPAVVIAQHIPELFSARWAERLDRVSQLKVCEAVDGQPLLQGCGYVAPGGRHMRVERRGTGLVCRIEEDAGRALPYRPCVNLLFDSVREAVGGQAVVALMTGMGNDGAEAMLALRQAGAFTVAQDEATSVVWGMPGEAYRMGAACEVVPLQRIAERLLSRVGVTPVPARAA